MTRLDAVLAEVKAAIEDYHDKRLIDLVPLEVVRGAAYWHDYSETHDEGSDLAAIVLLSDGRIAAFEGGTGCYTGWSCQASLDVTFHTTVEDAWLNGIGTDSRALIERTEKEDQS
jgi:hypothetical protein